MRLIDLDAMDLDELHREALQAGKRHASSEYHLIRCLVAAERRGLHRTMGCSSAVQYGVRHLELEGHKAAEMLRVGRVLKERHRLERAYREGRLSWSKVREVTRVVTAENEEFLVDFALEHNAGQVEALVAMSPARWKKQQQAAVAVAPPAPEPVLELEGLEIVVEAVVTGPPPAPAAPASPPPEPFVPLILLKRYLHPEQMALLEQAENKVRARLGGRPDQAAVLEEMARIVLSTGDSRTKVRYQVYLHVDGVTGQGWLDTDRGMLPAPAEVVQEALQQGRVEVVRSEAAGATPWPTARTVVPRRSPAEPESPITTNVVGESSSTWKSEPTPPIGSGEAVAPVAGGGRRKAIPTALLRKLYARARGRCEDCRRRVPLDSDHLDFYSENPTHDPERMRLRCKPCHSLRHEPDFASRPSWARAREIAMSTRKARDS